MRFVKSKIQIMVEILLSVLMTVTMVPILPVTAATSQFYDVQISDWFSDSVEYVNRQGLMKGTSEILFEPQTTMSRAMTVTVFYRMEGEPEAERSEFKDVPADTWFTNSVSWAAAEGIVNGYSKDEFGPSDDITREQIAAVLYRYAEKKGYDVSRRGDLNRYIDNDKVSDWAKDALSWANAEGLVVGLDDRTLASGANANRAQVATILKRFCEGVEKQNEQPAVDPGDKPADNPEPSDVRSFTDRLIELMPKDTNWTISPYSLEMCLAMVANGAKRKTQEELLDTLQISNSEKYNSEIRTLLETYDEFNSVMSLETANSIWINQDRFQGKGRFQQSFSDLLRLNYRAEAREVQDVNSVEEINAWADEKTHGKISRILEEENRKFAVALANAVYFKAAWQNKFSSETTKPQTFYNLNGTESEIPFMHQLGDFAYYEADGIQAVEMPYQNYTVNGADGMNMQFFKDADFGMYFLMSEKDLDLQEVLDHADFRREKVRLAIPKFKMKYGDSLADELKTLGVLTAFDPNQADLSGMIDPSDYPGMNRLYLDDVLQKAYLAIDEEGTEAAAVTVAIVKNGAAFDPPLIFDFTADHPFYFVIRDNTSGRILFAGKYNNTLN